MINFIVYEMDEKIRNKYELAILNFIGIREEKFKIFNYFDYNEINETNNIYIISERDFKNAIKIVSKIRNKEDWNSQIIVISEFDNTNLELLINQLLVLDYVNINSNYINRLKQDLYIAYKILTKDKTLNFCSNSEVNKIPYSNILYIEKNNNQNYCTIYTKDNEYIIKSTINNLEKELDSAYFLKTHRSCIVNLYNIEHYNSSKNIIYFIDGNKIDLISRDKRQILKSRLIEEKNIKSC